MDKLKKVFASKLLKIKAIKLQPNNPFTWASGWKSPFYCDNRKTLSYPDLRSYVKLELTHAVLEHFPEADAVAGVATGAIAQGQLVADELCLPFVYVRSKPKDHGLENLIEGELIAYFDDMQKDNPELDNIIQQFVDGVILPTYKDLKEKNDLLYAAVRNFQEHPTNVNFQNCASAWMASRTPWESSEAFLFGPVDAEGLDPNMDSWPLDASGIVAILNSSKFENMEWTGEYIPEPEDDEEAATMTDEDLEKAGEIAAAQNLRGFHTLEFLVFKKGQARRVN